MHFDLVNDLKKELESFKKINLTERKIEDKIRFIVRENFNNYLIYLEKLIINLENVSEKNPLKFLDELNSIIFNFEKKSAASYEKATFIVGELGKIKDRLDNFFQEAKRIVKDNTGFINENNSISIIELKLIEIEEISGNKKESEGDLKNIGKKITSLDDTIKTIEKNIEKVKNSVECLQEINKKEEYQKKKEEFEKEIYKLKEMIDFKILAGLFHSDREKMQIINNNRDNFKENFKADFGKKILNLIKEANLETNEIVNNISQLKNINKDIKSTVLEETYQGKLKELELELKGLNYEILSLKESKGRELKKIEKLDSIKLELSDEIKKELEKINIELI